MENKITVKDVLNKVVKILNDINIPVSQVNSIGIPVSKAVEGINMCLEAFEKQEAAQLEELDKEAEEVPENGD